MENDPGASAQAITSKPATGAITSLVRRWSAGDETAFDQLIELVYDDLRQIAHHHVRQSGRDTVGTTELVHEAYLKLAGVEGGQWESRSQFFAFCSKAMRHILTDVARRRCAAKRGGGAETLQLNDDTASIDVEAERILDVEEALQQLEKKDERLVRIIECRFFGGLSVPDTAEALSISTRTVERDWARARAYLYRALEGDSPR